MRKSKATADNAGYGAVNNAVMQETATHLDNLAHNTAADCNVVASILETNARLVAEIADSNATLAVAVADISALRLQLTGMGSGGRGKGIGGGRGSFQQHPGGRGPHPPRTVRRHNNGTQVQHAPGGNQIMLQMQPRQITKEVVKRTRH